MSKLNQKIYKFFNTKALSIDDANKTIKFRISDNKPDRMGEIVDQASWDLKSYEQNPIVLWGHDPSQPENVLGQGASIETSMDGAETWATLALDDDINPKAALVWKQLLKGTLRCVSIGFIPHTEELQNDVPVLKDNELLEISVVAIPANPRAVALAYKGGDIAEKDARWLVDSMRKEIDFVEAQTKVIKQETKSMTEEQAAALIDGMAKLTEKVDAQAEENKTLREEIAALKPKEETAEEKATREAAEKDAADKAAADAAKAKEEENVAAGLNPDGSAKDGSDDQSGAEGDEFDEDAELTPEQEAEAREALELEPAA